MTEFGLVFSDPRSSPITGANNLFIAQYLLTLLTSDLLSEDLMYNSAMHAER